MHYREIFLHLSITIWATHDELFDFLKAAEIFEMWKQEKHNRKL